MESNISNEKLGQIMAFILAMVGLLGALTLLGLGRSAAGFTVFFADLVSLVALFIYGKRKQGRELEEKRDALAQRARTN